MLLAKLFLPSILYDNGTNSPWDEQSGDELSGDEQCPNRFSLLKLVSPSIVFDIQQKYWKMGQPMKQYFYRFL